MAVKGIRHLRARLALLLRDCRASVALEFAVVGPMTIAVLLRNALVAAYRNAGLDLAADSI